MTLRHLAHVSRRHDCIFCPFQNDCFRFSVFFSFSKCQCLPACVCVDTCIKIPCVYTDMAQINIYGLVNIFLYISVNIFVSVYMCVYTSIRISCEW